MIKQLGKKYTNLPNAKRLKVRDEILELAKDVTYDELEPLFNTAVKKVGPRIAAVLILKVLLQNGESKNDDIVAFLDKAMEDKNTLLMDEARAI